MSPRTYYRASLLFPLLLPIAMLLLAGESSVAAILFISLGFGGVAYLVLAVVLYIWLGHLSSVAEMRRLSYKVPLLFIPVQSGFWLISYYVERMSNPELVGGWEGLPVFAVYILIIGYSYVLLVNLGCFAFGKLGWVREAEYAL